MGRKAGLPRRVSPAARSKVHQLASMSRAGTRRVERLSLESNAVLIQPCTNFLGSDRLAAAGSSDRCKRKHRHSCPRLWASLKINGAWIVFTPQIVLIWHVSSLSCSLLPFPTKRNAWNHSPLALSSVARCRLPLAKIPWTRPCRSKYSQRQTWNLWSTNQPAPMIEARRFHTTNFLPDRCLEGKGY